MEVEAGDAVLGVDCGAEGVPARRQGVRELAALALELELNHRTLLPERPVPNKRPQRVSEGRLVNDEQTEQLERAQVLTAREREPEGGIGGPTRRLGLELEKLRPGHRSAAALLDPDRAEHRLRLDAGGSEVPREHGERAR